VPIDYRKDMNMHYAMAPTTLGWVLVAATDQGVRAIFLGDHAESLERELAVRFPGEELTHDRSALRKLVARVARLIEQPGDDFDAALDLRGTEFQRKVWKALREIPAGATASYAVIAKRIGEPKSSRAVAQACGANPIAVVIPCHRVVRSDGALSGYRWGIERKRALLQRELRSGRQFSERIIGS
jgi:AraC family transcriptional regulator of adaptative response/methylated-DNA-[protein]-cysteine methyltransferase